jgi:hypothetical protein
LQLDDFLRSIEYGGIKIAGKNIAYDRTRQQVEASCEPFAGPQKNHSF